MIHSTLIVLLHIAVLTLGVFLGRYILNLKSQIKKSRILLRKSFKGTVLSLTPKEVVQTMIDGLNYEWVKVNMSTYGTCGRKKVCYGCAATNSICELIQQPILPEDIDYNSKISLFIGLSDVHFLNIFESAINQLRRGNISQYNVEAISIGMATLPKKDFYLPSLENDNWKRHLHYYQEYANSL